MADMRPLENADLLALLRATSGDTPCDVPEDTSIPVDDKLELAISKMIANTTEDKHRAVALYNRILTMIDEIERDNALVDEEIRNARAENREPKQKFKRSYSSLLEQCNSALDNSIKATDKLVALTNMLGKMKLEYMKRSGDTNKNKGTIDRTKLLYELKEKE
jgi:hypothetical protein